MGRRGHGKRLVLKRVLSSLRSLSPKPLRVVTLNGILLRGGDDSLAVREILRQLSPRHNENPTFHSSLTSLSDLFTHARIDSDPLLIVLHELDYFAATDGGLHRGKQILLYKLFDRAGDHGSKLSIVGTMSKLSTSAMFEKRVRSRATGNLCIVDFPHYPYDTLVDILSNKFEPVPVLQRQIRALLSEHDSQSRGVFERHYNLGKDVRWFCRVFSTILSLTSGDVVRPDDVTLALDCMGVESARQRALRDVSVPQLTILLCARRILKRQALCTDESTPPPPLTFERVTAEYDHLVAKHSTLKYSSDVLYQSFLHLLGGDLMKVVKDHSGGGCEQYSFSEESCMDSRTKVGVEITLELERELDAALKKGDLNCPTTLKNWGLMMN